MNKKLSRVLLTLSLMGMVSSQSLLASDSDERDLKSSHNVVVSNEIVKAQDDQEKVEEASKGILAIIVKEPEAGIQDNKTSIISKTFEEVKYLDQNASKLAGQAAKAKVEELGMPGKIITCVTGVIGQEVFGTETLTEGVLDTIRKPFKIEEDEYPDTVEGLVGKKAQKFVNTVIPGGSRITSATGYLGKTFFGTPTLTEGLIKTFYSKPIETTPQIADNDKPAIEIVPQETDEDKKVDKKTDK